MSYFVINYPLGSNANFFSVTARGIREDQMLYGAGSFTSNGLFACTQGDGTPIWFKTYLINGRSIGFRHVLSCDNGEFILYGSMTEVSGQGPTNDRNRNLVLRVKSDGNVIWAKTYYTGRTRYNLEIAKGTDDRYFMTSWSNNYSSVDDIEVISIDGNGNIIAARTFSTGSDDQVNGITSSGEGCIVYGITGSGSGWDCFAIQLDINLNINWSYIYGNSEFQEFRALITPDGGRTIYATGETGTSRKSFFSAFQPGNGSINVTVLDQLQAGNEAGYKRLLFTGQYVYLLSSPWLTPNQGTLTAFGGSVGIVWHKKLSLPDTHLLPDIEVANNDLKDPDLLIGGVSMPVNGTTRPLLVHSDKDFNTCITQNLPLPKENVISFTERNYNAKPTDIKPDVENQDVTVRDLMPQVNKLCPVSGGGVTLDGNPRSQSPYIYLQNAGSTGADKTVPGFHLRWDLLRRLGESHLPKGNLIAQAAYSTSIGYNRNDDFVRIFRMPFKTDYGVQVNFTTPPTTLNENGAVREWTWSGLIPSPGRTSSVVLRFADVNLYSILRSTINPMVNPQQFIQQYTGRMEARIAGKLAFLVQFGLGGSQGGSLRAELIGLPDVLDLTSRRISCRSQHTITQNQRQVCENIEYVRFDYSNGLYPISIRLAAYEDYLYATAPQWQFVGEYSLDDGNSDNNAAVYRALEDTTRFTVNARWPKFNETGSAGEFTVSVPNYKSRWTNTQEGLKQAVVTYLDSSRTDLEANVILANTGGDPNDTSTTEVSYLDMLNFVALDFHVARMLGLGTIDPLAREQERTEYVYLMKYVTTAQLENETPALVTHYYMTPPATMSTFKLPPAPVQLPITYGLGSDHCGVASGPTNAQGYAPNANLRYININRDKFRHELPFENFYATPATFCTCNETVPVMFGVEYAAGPNNTGTWIRPELSHDINYADPGGMPETAPIPDTGNATVYTHGETQAGVHHYALYSINWFSRVSVLSNQQQTDTTVFPIINRMLPPFNLAIQLIQREPALLFTTQAEQNKRNAITASDKTLMRALFDWNHIHNRAYQFADKAQLLFRTQPPLVVRGEISTGAGSLVVDTFSHTVLIKTQPYTIFSTNPAQVVQPNVANATEAQRYVGGRCVIDGEPFIVDSITTYGNNPYIRLKQIRQTISADPNGDNTFCTLENWISPQEGKRFIMVENLDQVSSWDKVITKTVALTSFSPVHTETVTYPDGLTVVETIGGLTDTATISHIWDTDPNISNLFPPGVPPGTQVPTGGYLVTFNTKQLANHPDPEVSYYQGLLRVRDVNGDIKELQVLEINNSGATLILKAADPAFALKINPGTGKFIWLSGNFEREENVLETATGPGKFVNYHPSYKAYFYADAPFAEPAILPAFGQGTKQTYIGIRALDSVNNRQSYIATPAVLLALELNEPVAPLIPPSPMFATRPNYYGKATYTFDLQVQQPFALLFFRASDRTILDQLYKPATVTAILNALAALPPADAIFNTLRWRELANMVTDSGTGLFKQYTAGGYRFPIPDNDKYAIPDPLILPVVYPFTAGNVPPGSTAVVPGTNGMTMADIVKDAIDGAFLPLTEEPAIYSQLKATSLQTSGRKPRINDDSGRRLPVNDPRYDAAPMAIRYEKNGPAILLQGNANYGLSGNQRFVRFTDYTLDGGAVNQYFYFAAEMSNRLEFSPRSEVIGPIQLVNARPTETPGIKTINVSESSTVLRRPPGVKFELNDYVESEGIKKIAIFRATNADDALSVRTMKFVKFVDAGQELTDDFTDLTFPPYGELIYYRLAAQREIMNEQNQPELIPSQPTDKVMVSIIDNINPPPAEITASYTAVSSPAPQLNNVVLNWNATCYNGTYHLYKMTTAGNWEKIYTAVPGITNAVTIALSATTFANANLPKTDSDANTIYHRFKVQVVNSSGLVNITEREITL